MILNDRSLSWLQILAVRYKNKSLDQINQFKKLLQLAQMVYYGKKYTKENRKIK